MDASALSNNVERCSLYIPPLREPTPALFLDRDGVVIDDGHHLCDPDQVRVCRGARELIAEAHRHGWPVVVITNQSGIARGLFSWTEVEHVNARMQDLLGVEAPLAAIYANGHGPEAPASSWRKPGPKMLMEAAIALNLDLQRSLLVGDRLSDLQAGAAAGLTMVFHVMSGHGRNARAAVLQWQEQRRVARNTDYAIDVQLLDTLEAFPLTLLQQGIPTPR